MDDSDAFDASNEGEVLQLSADQLAKLGTGVYQQLILLSDELRPHAIAYIQARLAAGPVNEITMNDIWNHLLTRYGGPSRAISVDQLDPRRDMWNPAFEWPDRAVLRGLF